MARREPIHPTLDRTPNISRTDRGSIFDLSISSSCGRTLLVLRDNNLGYGLWAWHATKYLESHDWDSTDYLSHDPLV